MNWLNIETSLLDSEEFIGCSPAERATWLCLLRYCAGQENGGTITDCREWSDRRWQQLARITKDEAHTTCALWSWDGYSLKVWQYPIEREMEVRAKRDGGRKTVAKRWANSSVDSSAINSAHTEGEGEGKEKRREGKEKEKAVQAAPTAPILADQLTLSPDLKPAKAKRAKKQPAQTEAEWLASLAASPAYAGIDVAREHGKASQWCSVRSRTLTRQTFVNWLNRADKPLTASNAQRTATTQFRHNAIASSDYRGISD